MSSVYGPMEQEGIINGKYRKLGNTDLNCSEISLGTWAFSGRVYGQSEESHCIDTVHRAMELGINLFDTAPLYGTAEEPGISERILGKGLETKRDEVLISTKFGRLPGRGLDDNFFDREGVVSSVENSLSRLQTDRIDLLFFHSPFHEEDIKDDVWEGLDQLKKDGKVCCVGHSISNFEHTHEMALRWSREGKIDAIQVVLSLMNRESLELISKVSELGVGVVGRECLANGFLTDAVKRDTEFPARSLNSRYSREVIVERVEQCEKYASALSREDMPALASRAMRWVLDQKGITTALTGAMDISQLEEGAAVSDLPAFSPEQIQAAAEVHTKDYPAA